jgi:hypothetical protein
MGQLKPGRFERVLLLLFFVDAPKSISNGITKTAIAIENRVELLEKRGELASCIR